ncbi:MAG: DUF2209 family protein [Chloroflexota bacterium]
MFSVIAFDADDTLWHNEPLYFQSKERFKTLFSDEYPPDLIEQTLNQIEVGNIEVYGYGIKSFVLSMVETAIQLAGEQVPGSVLQSIVGFAKQMMQAELQLLEHVEETLQELSSTHDLMVITKGDLFEQEKRIARSGLRGYFRYVEVVGEKSEQSYRALLDKYGIAAEKFLMVGNSLRSDILPVLAIGGHAVYVHYPHTWEHENVVDFPVDIDAYIELEHLGQLPEVVEMLERGG